MADKPNVKELNKKAEADAALVKSLEKQLRDLGAEIAADESRFDGMVAALNDGNVSGDPKNHDAAEKFYTAIEKKKLTRTVLVARLNKARTQAELSAAARRAGELSAAIDRNAGFWGDPQTEGTFLGELAKVERGLGDAVKAFRKAIEISERKIQPSHVGHMPIHGLGVHPGEIIEAIQSYLAKIGRKPPVTGKANAKQEVSFPGGKVSNLALWDQPEKLPSLIEWATDKKNYALDLQRGIRRFDGKDAGQVAPADPGLWPVAGPETPAPPPGTPSAAPRIDGLNEAPRVSDADSLADILGEPEPPARDPDSILYPAGMLEEERRFMEKLKDPAFQAQMESLIAPKRK